MDRDASSSFRRRLIPADGFLTINIAFVLHHVKIKYCFEIKFLILPLSKI